LQNGDFAYNADTARFVDKMVREHGFEPQQLHDVLAQTKNWILLSA
jgi:membrane-bound lytic murein transglycosylase B